MTLSFASSFLNSIYFDSFFVFIECFDRIIKSIRAGEGDLEERYSYGPRFVEPQQENPLPPRNGEIPPYNRPNAYADDGSDDGAGGAGGAGGDRNRTP